MTPNQRAQNPAAAPDAGGADWREIRAALERVKALTAPPPSKDECRLRFARFLYETSRLSDWR